jgi:selenium metabolism protein YedF
VEERTLDCRGLSCPQPVILTRQALQEMGHGTLQVLLDNEASCANVMRLAQSQGHEVRQESPEPGQYRIFIERGEGSSQSCEPPAVVCEAQARRSTVVYVPSETLGRGDEALGGVLMAAYLDTLAQFAQEISHVIFINSGVKLAVEGSPVLEQIQALERMGAQVLCCGTCLNHFRLADRLRVGSISNMLAILEVISRAGRVMSL